MITTEAMPQHPPDYTDTDPRAMEVWLELLRRMPPGDRLGTALQLSGFALQMGEAGVRSRYPEAEDREILVRVAASYLPRELMISAYGWDPEADVNTR
jgi:hypothetical protein